MKKEKKRMLPKIFFIGTTLVAAFLLIPSGFANAAVQMTLSASPSTIQSGESTTLNWTITIPSDTACSSPDIPSFDTATWIFIGNDTYNGTVVVGELNSSTTYHIYCDEPQPDGSYVRYTASADVTVTVQNSIGVKLTVSQNSISWPSCPPNCSTTLIWTTSGSPDTCVASNGWSGSKNVNGGNQSITLTPSSTNQLWTFELKCSKSGLTDVTSIVTVNVPAPPPASVQISATQVDLSQTYYSSVSCLASGPYGTCTASGSWIGTKVCDGNIKTSVGPLWQIPYTFNITCKSLYSWQQDAFSTVTITPYNSSAVTPISVSITATPSEMALPDRTARIKWSTTGNPDYCTATGAWSGNKANSGEVNQNVPFVGPNNFGIICRKAGTADAVSNATVMLSDRITYNLCQTVADCPHYRESCWDVSCHYGICASTYSLDLCPAGECPVASCQYNQPPTYQTVPDESSCRALRDSCTSSEIMSYNANGTVNCRLIRNPDCDCPSCSLAYSVSCGTNNLCSYVIPQPEPQPTTNYPSSPIVSLSALPQTGPSPLSTSISWSVSQDSWNAATQCNATEGTSGWPGSKSVTSGTFPTVVTSPTRFVITCSNAVGSDTEEITVTPLTPMSYNLTINRPYGGAITTSDGNINCGTQCSYTYGDGSPITLKANPLDSQWQFVGWTGSCYGTGDYVFNIYSNTSCSALFVRKPLNYSEF